MVGLRGIKLWKTRKFNEKIYKTGYDCCFGRAAERGNLMEHKIPTLSSALSNHPESFFINNGAKVRFGTELKLTICHDVAPMRNASHRPRADPRLYCILYFRFRFHNSLQLLRFK